MSEAVIKNWLALAEYDMTSAEVMFQTGRYVYVTFMCQQAIEKMMKALYVREYQQTPPYTHNLTRLLSLLSFSNEATPNDRDFFERLNYYYLESRYSETIFELYKTLTENQASDIYMETKRVYQWLQDKIL